MREGMGSMSIGDDPGLFTVLEENWRQFSSEAGLPSELHDDGMPQQERIEADKEYLAQRLIEKYYDVHDAE